MMNETGSYPGQVWLWLYTFWYQIAPFNTSDNADAQIWALMMVLSAWPSSASPSSRGCEACPATSASTA